MASFSGYSNKHSSFVCKLVNAEKKIFTTLAPSVESKSRAKFTTCLYYKRVTIVNYTSVCSVAYDCDLRPLLMILAKAKLGLYCKLQS
jgi:hypothetical protein